MNKEEARLSTIIEWIRSTTDVVGGRGALVPISGGSDSALCFWLCSQALPYNRAVGVYIGTQLRCQEWFEQAGALRLLPPLPGSAHVEAHAGR